ncbi:MAG: ATP-binding protein [Promethearchaeota archaeon]
MKITNKLSSLIKKLVIKYRQGEPHDKRKHNGQTIRENQSFSYQNFQRHLIFTLIIIAFIVSLILVIICFISLLPLRYFFLLGHFGLYIPFALFYFKKYRFSFYSFIFIEEILFNIAIFIYPDPDFFYFGAILLIVAGISGNMKFTFFIYISEIIFLVIEYIVGIFGGELILNRLLLIIMPGFVFGIILTKIIIGTLKIQQDRYDQLKFSQKQLLMQEKMRSLSVVVGGIAHDFNNILTAILGNLDLIKTFTNPSEEIYEFANEAENASQRAKNLTRELLTFSKGGAPMKKEVISLAELVEDNVKFYIRGTRIKAYFSVQKDLWSIEANTDQISQVILNLTINAIQSMPNGGNLIFQAYNVRGIPDLEHAGKIIPGKYIKFSIQDTGKGIPQKNLTRIFDPYFTTKKEGNGLGLSVCYSIIQSHGGLITVDSIEGKGTVFRIFLPASEKIKFSDRLSKKNFIPIPMEGTVLVMDDDNNVRETLKSMLEKIGFSVLCSKDGEETVKKYWEFKKKNQKIDVVILDLTIPGGLGGKEIINDLKSLDPNLKAVLSTGHSADPIVNDFRKFGFQAVLFKPYTIEEVAKIFEIV